MGALVRSRIHPDMTAHESIQDLSGLASFVAQLVELQRAWHKSSARFAKPHEAPHLYRQLGQALADLHGSVEAAQGRSSGAPPKAASSENSARAKRAGFLSRWLEGRPRPPAPAPDASPSAKTKGQDLHGNIATMPLDELLSYLANASKCGVLWIHGPKENALLEFKDGRLIHATSDATPENLRIGEILVAQQALPREALERHVREHPGGSNLLGGELALRGLIDEAQLTRALERQVRELMRRLLETKEAFFRFQDGLQLLVPHGIRLHPIELLLDCARQRDSAARVHHEEGPAAEHSLFEAV
jgi:hypothetical protein